MASHWKWMAAAALLLGACGRGSGRSPASDDWMDGATVRVALDAAAGRETVTLVDPASGFEQVMDDEPLVDVNEQEEGDEG